MTRDELGLILVGVGLGNLLALFLPTNIVTLIMLAALVSLKRQELRRALRARLKGKL